MIKTENSACLSFACVNFVNSSCARVLPACMLHWCVVRKYKIKKNCVLCKYLRYWSVCVCIEEKN